MKKLIIITIILVSLGFLVGLGVINYKQQVAQDSLFMAQVGTEIPDDLVYNLEVKTDQLPTQAKFYKSATPIINDKQVRDLAAKFGVDGTVRIEGKRMIVEDKRNKNIIFQIDQETGYYSYLNFNKLGNLDIEKSIPEDDVAITKAKEYLKQRELLPDRFDLIKVTNRTTGAEFKGTKRVLSKEVWFHPTIEGKVVSGIARIIVSVGDKGEIEAVRKYHREIKAAKEVALKSFEQAFGELKAGKASITCPKGANKIDITKVELRYWEDPDEVKVIPVYLFTGETVIEGKVEIFTAFLPASKGGEMKFDPKNI